MSFLLLFYCLIISIFIKKITYLYLKNGRNEKVNNDNIFIS